MRWVFASLLLLGCDPTGPGADAAVDASRDASGDGSGDAGVELRAVAGPSRYALVGEEVVLDASASSGATRFVWHPGDGGELEGAVARVVFGAPGRYRAVLEAFDERGRRRTDSLLVSVTHPIVHTPRQSGSVAVWPDRREVAVVSPDSGELAVFSYAGGGLELVARHATAEDPRTVTVWRDRWVVVCQAGGRAQLLDPEGGAPREVALPRASRPFGAVGTDEALFVTLASSGEVVRLEATGDAPPAVAARFFAIEDARDLALLPDGRLAVSRWRSPDEAAEIAVVSADGAAREVWTLALDPQAGSDTESGGVPSYLGPLLVDPTGRLAVMPSLQAAIGEGRFRSPRPLTHETTLRAAVSFVDPASGVEDLARRKLFDDRGFASAGAISPSGDFLYVAMRGSRTVERLDLLTGAQAGTIPGVGLAPQGLALSEDGGLLFVDAYLSRELVLYDVSDAGALPLELARAPIPVTEPLGAEVLRGKVLFNDSADTRLGRDGYIACAHCHLEGLSDHRTWDFTDRGEGLRNTIDLLGRAGVGHGPLHWSANFDEVQDFEHDIRGPFRGTGLMEDADLEVGTRGTPLGDPKAGVSADLDALAAYVTALDAHLPSPHRDAVGALPPAAARGRAVFASAGCPSCHAGAALTDSGFEGGAPRLHDVGTLGAGSGQRLGGPLSGLDTPTLHGLWQSAPYLHDGSAPTLRSVLVDRNVSDRHGATAGLSFDAIDDLVAYLLCLDGAID